ncbi:MAG: phage holin family protein [Fimbriimonadaceae bacterium]|nr:phage holin family protein [Chitinophagales bacterium]
MENEMNPQEKIDVRGLTDDVKDYFDMRSQIIRLNVTEKISKTLAGLITSVGSILFYLGAFLFVSFALCYWIGSVMENTSLGFLIVAGGYLIIGILIKIISNAFLRSKLTDTFINEFSNDDDES